MNELERSYQYCEEMLTKANSNFDLAIEALPIDKRRALRSIYAFFRAADDIGDSYQPAEVRKRELARFRRQLDKALGGNPQPPLFPALMDAVDRYGIPPRLLFDALDGVKMDLAPRTYQTWEDLAVYCFRVAGTVGLVCLYVWEFEDPLASILAIDCGHAFQLTNILRDLMEDADRGRIYLPLEDLRRFDYTVADLQGGVVDDRFRELVRFEISRAEEYYERAAMLPHCLPADGASSFALMFSSYHALLSKIQRRTDRLLTERISLSYWNKAGVLWKAMRLMKLCDIRALNKKAEQSEVAQLLDPAGRPGR